MNHSLGMAIETLVAILLMLTIVYCVMLNKRLTRLKVGDTLPLDMRADANVTVRCGDVTLTEGRMGRVGDRVAIRVTKPLRKPHTTYAMFEKADETTKMMEAQ